MPSRAAGPFPLPLPSRAGAVRKGDAPALTPPLRPSAPPLSLPSPVEDLLLWRDVPKTGAVVGGITALYLLLEW